MNFLSVPVFLFDFVNPLDVAFGWMTRIFYEFFGSYGIAIIVLTIVIRGLLIPLNVRSQRSMMKSQTLSSQQAEIRRKYPDDKAKQNEELSKLMSENGAQSFTGCILPFLQIFFIWPIFNVVRNPLQYLTQISTENIKNLGTFLFESGAITKAENAQVAANNIPIIRAFQHNASLLADAVGKGFIKLGQMVDLNFLGIDLSMQPEWKPNVLFGSEWRTYVPLLVIPILVLVSTLIQMQIANILKPNYKADKEAKARAKLNPARKDQVTENPMENSMKIMNWAMPVIMLVTTFTLPSAMGLYWLIGNIMAIIQQFVIYILFTKPFEAKKAEMAILKAHAFSKTADAAVLAGGMEALPGKSGNRSNKGGKRH